ncbi:MAG: hypothetical protein RL199_622 [Pseudomonadota bacterium]
MEAIAPPEPVPETSSVYPLLPPSPSPWRSVFIGVLACMLAAAGLQRFGVPQTWAAPAGLLVALGSGTLLQSLARRYVADALALLSDRIELRRGSRRLRTLDLRRLAEVNEFATELGPVLLLTDHRHTVALLKAQLVRPADFDDLRTRIVERVGALDPTGALGRRAVAAARLREVLARRPVRFTPLLAAWLALSALLSSWVLLPALAARPFPAEEAGALSRVLVFGGDVLAATWRNGEWWRLTSYPFLHPTPMHAALSMAGILWLGAFLERLVGWERVLVAFTAGVVGGAGGYLATGSPVAASGASSGVFGLVGLLAVVATLHRSELPAVLLPRAGAWGATMLLALLLPGAGPLSFAGDLAGLAAGAAAALVMRATPLTDADAGRPWRPLAWLSVAALGLGFVGGVTHGRRGHGDDGRVVLGAYLQLPPTEASTIVQNDTAYLLLMRPSPTAEVVSVAAALAEAAVRQSARQDASMLDTLAVARLRQGNVREARTLVEEALRLPVDERLRTFLEKRLSDLAEGRPLPTE